MTSTSNASSPRPHNPIRLREAWKALKELIRDPDRTDRVFVIIDALSGNTGERLFRRFEASPVGARVLAEKRNILTRLSDREYLQALPPASAGAVYADFMNREQLDAAGLVEASEHGSREPNGDPGRLLFGARLRDTHDLWHVVTGYNRDLVGEAALLSFTFAQTRNPGIGVIVAMAYLLARGEERHGRKLIRAAYRRGRDAAWLPGADWENLLSRPLSEVRSELRVGDPPQYSQVRSADGEAALAVQ
ncbi:MAG: Coq4 family protein [Myxococcota bacterium]